jgi:hypothetical protein
MMKASSERRSFIAPFLVIAIMAGMTFAYLVRISSTNSVAIVAKVAARDSSNSVIEPMKNAIEADQSNTSSVSIFIDNTSTTDTLATIDNSTYLVTSDTHTTDDLKGHFDPMLYANNTVILWEGVDGMNTVVSRYWKGNLFCEKINEVRSVALDPDLPITVKFTFGCKDLYENSELGTGNFIALMYGIRLAAHVYGNIDVYFTCYDAEETKKDLIIPWLTGWFPPRPVTQNSSVPISIQEACGNYDSQPISYMYKEIQNDLRNMAIGLMGVQRPDHPSAPFAETMLASRDLDATEVLSVRIPQLPIPQRNESPLFSSSEYELDDAVLHFRCGDLMDSKHPSFGFMKFSGYARHISPEATSIGIITQPFDAGTQSRKADSGQHKRDRCRTVVNSLVEYIKERHPKAQVRIHNGVNETIALTFARMIMANQTIAGISSFGVIPAVSTFGTGYIRTPDYRKAPNKWLLNPRIDERTETVVLFNEPKRIAVGTMKGLWQNEGEKGVLEWFWNDTIP